MKITRKVIYPDTKVNGANMGPIWGRQDPGGLHVGPMDFAIWVHMHLGLLFDSAVEKTADLQSIFFWH